MNRVKIMVCPGICGMDTEIEMAVSDDQVKVSGSSPCAKVNALLQRIDGADAFALAMTPLPTNPAIVQAGECRLHAACPIPTALIKAAEVCAGLALKHDVHIQFVAE